MVVPNDKYRQPKETEENALGRLYTQAIPGVIEFLACKEEHIPNDLTFRDAWKKGDTHEPIKIDFAKALEIHRGRLKEAATQKIFDLSIELEVALKGNSLPLQVSLRRTCSILTTIHEMNMTHCKCIADIKYTIPKELHDVWHFYPPLRSGG